MESLVRYRQRELNVILVEWESGSTQTYPQSVANTRIVAAEMARLLKITQVSLDSLTVYVNHIPTMQLLTGIHRSTNQTLNYVVMD